MNNPTDKPTMNPLKVGDEFKTFAVSGKAGMKMPEHISTKEAVVIVKDGDAILHMDGDHKLAKGEVAIIPAGKVHSLSLKSNFEAVGIMAKDSEIEFK